MSLALIDFRRLSPSSRIPSILSRGHRFIALPLSMDESQGTLPIPPSLSHEPTSTFDDVPRDEKEVSSLDKSSSGLEDADEIPQYVNGEPVINSGRDVSKFLVDLRDDEDPPFTFRSIVLGTVIGGLGAALVQVCRVYFSSTRSHWQTLACRSISLNQLPRGPQQFFFSSLFIHLGNFGQPSFQIIR